MRAASGQHRDQTGVEAVGRFGQIDVSSFIGKGRKDPQERCMSLFKDSFRNSVSRTKMWGTKILRNGG